ncbi:hypothetical protein [Streptomyces lutosisoli]|uniref:ABC transporter permease n=1 Tax=Streptomyces lutosisoli TaxID=2665721 RepID=A0ABW2VXU7_9ACTN
MYRHTAPPGDVLSDTAPLPEEEHPASNRHARGHHSLTDSEPGIPPSVLAAAAGVRKAMVVPVVTALAIGTLFVAVYLAAFHAPSVRHQPLGIAASDKVAASTELALSDAAPDAYTFHRYANTAAAREAIKHDEVPAVLVAGKNGGRPVLLVAGAQGPSTLSSLTTAVSKAVGTQVKVQDIDPLTPQDARGLSVFYASFGVVLAGFLFAVSSYSIAPRMVLSGRVASMGIFSLAIGLAVALIAHTAFGALPAAFVTVATIATLLAAATAAAAGVLMRLFGPLGMPVSSVVLLILGNATSGGVLPTSYLPGWLAPLSHFMAPAAAVRALRGAAYFDSVHLVGSLAVLASWPVVCLAVQYAMDRAAARRRPA